MHVRLLTACLLFYIAASPAQQNGSAKPNSAQEQHRNPNSVNTNKASEGSPKSLSPAGCQQQPDPNAAQQQYDPRLDKLYRAYLWATILGLIGGLIGLYALIRQTMATHTAANAAKASADAFMAKEQAWLLIWYDKFAHVDYQDRKPGDYEMRHNFNWHCQNIGSTPAFITESWARLIEIRSLDDLPSKPDYSMAKPIRYQGDPLRPEGKTDWFTAPVESSETIKTYEAIEKRHRSKASFLYAYGFARYRDVFRRPLMVKFGVVYDSQPKMNFDRDYWRVAGPDSYNDYEMEDGKQESHKYKE